MVEVDASGVEAQPACTFVFEPEEAVLGDEPHAE